jgi:hypothetical protein
VILSASQHRTVANKLARATMMAPFFLACIAALELEGVALDEIWCTSYFLGAKSRDRYKQYRRR